METMTEVVQTIPCEACGETLAVVIDRHPDTETIARLRLADEAREHLRSHA